MSKIKAKSQKSPDKSSDIARYLDSDVVEFDEKKRDWIYKLPRIPHGDFYVSTFAFGLQTVASDHVL
jgi:hypothetical protein